MANIIDALVVTLGLDPTNFTAGQRKAIEDLKKLDQTAKAQAQAEKARHDKEAAEGKRQDREKDRRRQEEQRKEKEAAQAREKVEKEAAKGRAEAYTLAKEAALGFGAAIAAIGVEKLVSGVAASVAQTGLLARNLGLTTPALAAWGNAVEKSVGGSAEAANGTLQALTQSLVAFQTQGDTSLIPLVAQLERFSSSKRAFNMNAPDGKGLDAIGLMKEISSYAPEMSPKIFSSILAGAGFDPGTINFLERGPAGVESELDWQKKNGVASQAQADAALGVVQAEVGLQQAFTNLKNTLVLDFAPGIIHALKVINDWLTSLTHPFRKASGQDDGQPDSSATGSATQPQTPAGDGLTEPDGTVTATPGQIIKKIGRQARNFIRGQGWLEADVSDEVQADAKRHGLDPAVMKALFQAESGGYANVSPAGAFGPAQLMPGTAAEMGVATSPSAPNYDWHKNVDAGIRYFAKLLAKSHGNYQVAAAAYNAGFDNPGVQKYAITGEPSDLPNETGNYLNNISSLLPSGFFMPPVYNYHDPSAGPTTNSNSSEVHIGTVNVNGVDTNHAGHVAAGMKTAVQSHPLVQQADAGLF